MNLSLSSPDTQGHKLQTNPSHSQKRWFSFLCTILEQTVDYSGNAISEETCRTMPSCPLWDCKILPIVCLQQLTRKHMNNPSIVDNIPTWVLVKSLHAKESLILRQLLLRHVHSECHHPRDRIYTAYWVLRARRGECSLHPHLVIPHREGLNSKFSYTLTILIPLLPNSHFAFSLVLENIHS